MLFTTLFTAGAVLAGMVRVTQNTLEQELASRGIATAEFVALAAGPLLLDKKEKATQLLYLLNSLTGDRSIENAIIADDERVIVAAIAPFEGAKRGDKLNEVYVEGESKWHMDNAYYFRVPVKFEGLSVGTFILVLSRSHVEAALRRATKKGLSVVGLISMAIVIITLALIRRELIPLKLMGEALNTIALGDFSRRVPILRRDEIGDLGHALNHMLVRAELFFHYVDKMVIERLVNDESLVRPGGREHDLAVLFGDMRGYTALSNRKSADQVVRIVNTYFHLFIECIAHFGGMVDKTMGDAIMAVFERMENNPPKQHREAAVLALAYMKASSRILNAYLQLHPEIGEESGLEPKEFGFAMATGPAIIGNIGSRRRMDYTVCGRVVNLASRLEGLTKQGEVIIDNFTHYDTEHLALVETLAPVQPKGFKESEKVTPHRVIALTPEIVRRMRPFLKRVFSYAFIQEKLMPEGLASADGHHWCTKAKRELEDIIEQTPVELLFCRFDTERGTLMIPEGVTLPLYLRQDPASPAPPLPQRKGSDDQL